MSKEDLLIRKVFVNGHPDGTVGNVTAFDPRNLLCTAGPDDKQVQLVPGKFYRVQPKSTNLVLMAYPGGRVTTIQIEGVDQSTTSKSYPMIMTRSARIQPDDKRIREEKDNRDFIRKLGFTD